MTRTAHKRSACPISYSLDLFGDKWTLLIMRDVLLFGRCYFREFARDERIASNILADRLARLESAGLLDKQRDPLQGNQYIYSPTDSSWQLLPLLVELLFWGACADPHAAVSDDYRTTIAHEKDLLKQEIMLAAKTGTFVDYYHNTMGIQR
jgi:putative transcriptional regulator